MDSTKNEIPVTKENYKKIKILLYKRVFLSYYALKVFLGVTLLFGGGINIVAYTLHDRLFPEVVIISTIAYVVFGSLLPIIVVDLNFNRALKDPNFRFKKEGWLKDF